MRPYGVSKGGVLPDALRELGFHLDDSSDDPEARRLRPSRSVTSMETFLRGSRSTDGASSLAELDQLESLEVHTTRIF